MLQHKKVIIVAAIYGIFFSKQGWNEYLQPISSIPPNAIALKKRTSRISKLSILNPLLTITEQKSINKNTSTTA